MTVAECNMLIFVISDAVVLELDVESVLLYPIFNDHVVAIRTAIARHLETDYKGTCGRDDFREVSLRVRELTRQLLQWASQAGLVTAISTAAAATA